MRRSYIIAAVVFLLLVAKYAKSQDNWGYSGLIVGSGPPPLPAGPLTVTISCSPTVGPTTLTTACAAVPVGGLPPYAYTWVWGDGTANSTTQNPNHNFTVAGTRTITLTVTDSTIPLATQASQVKTVLATGAAYYVQASGNDTTGISPSTAFHTLTECQTAMRTGNKVCIINDSGTYTLGANLALTTADNSEVWAAGFGQTPTVSGNSAFGITVLGTNPIAFYGVTFTNMQSPATAGGAGDFSGLSFGADSPSNFSPVNALTFRWNTITNTNFIQMQGPGLTNSLIDSNTFKNQTSPVGTEAFNGGALDLWSTAAGNTFSHNLCTNLNGYCFNLNSGSGVNNNNTITLNRATNVGIQAFDSGAFYYCDECVVSGITAGTSTGNSFTYNQVFGNLSSNSSAASTGPTAAYYLDAFAANVTVKGNVCNQCGNFALHVSGLNHVSITQNIFDTSADAAYSGAGVTVGIFDQAVNAASGSFDHNIIYNDSVAWPTCGSGSTWFLLGSGTPLAPASVTTNLYYSTTGNYPNPNGIRGGCAAANVTDTNPFNANPSFVNAGANNYALQSGSAAFTDLSFPVLPTNQGPVNSPFVAAGSTF